jgi:hypothetical protein
VDLQVVVQWGMEWGKIAQVASEGRKEDSLTWEVDIQHHHMNHFMSHPMSIVAINARHMDCYLIVCLIYHFMIE